MADGIAWDDEPAHDGIEWDDGSHAKPGIPEAAAAAPHDPGLLRSLGSKFEQGFFKGGSDELAGAATSVAVDPEGDSVGWRQPDGTVKRLHTRGDAHRAGRDAEREVLRGAEHHHRWPGEAAELAGDIASDVALVGAKAVSPIYQAASGALTGLMGSDADLSDGVTAQDAARAGGSTVLGGTLGYVVPVAADAISRRVKGSRLERFLAERLGKAQGEIDQQAAETLAKSRLSARGELGNAAKTAHTAGRELEDKYLQGRMTDDEAKAFLSQLDDPAIRELDRTLIANSLKNHAEGPAKVGQKRAVMDQIVNDTPGELARLQDEIGNHPFRRTVAPFLGRYGPQLASAAAGAIGAGGATNSLLAAGGGALAGGLLGNRFKRGAAAVGSKLADEAGEVLDKDAASVLERAAAKVAAHTKDTFGKIERSGENFSPAGALAGGVNALIGENTGPAAQAAKRRAQSPDVRKWWYRNLQKIVSEAPDLLGKFGPVIARERQRHGPEGAFAMHEALTAENPDYLLRSMEIRDQIEGDDAR